MSEEPTRNLPADSGAQILFLLRGIDARLTSLEERVDRRLMETRPIWEQVLLRMDGLDNRVDNLGLDTRAGFKRLERQMGQIAADYVAVRTDQSDLERRMDRLEDTLEPKPVG